MDMPLRDAPADATDLEHLRQEADRLRDEQSWADAAEAYGQYLRLCAEDGPIWVQYGHCLKEGGDPKGALLCYREAERLLPEDSDLQLQIGHALKLLGRDDEAFSAYALALTLDPGNVFARAELMGGELPSDPLPKPAPKPASPPRPAPALTRAVDGALVFDASDLLDYFRHNRAPTGIQRVQLNIIREALAADAEATTLVAFDPRTGAWKALPTALFLDLAELSATGADTREAEWVALVATVTGMLRGAAPHAFAPDSALVNLGTSWWIPDYLRRVREAKSRFGIRYIPFVHDCIPLEVPEHCAEGLVNEFARWFAGLCLHADAVLVNSESSAEDFRRWQRAVLPRLEIPCFRVPLDAAPPMAEPGALPEPVRDGRPYVLAVGTIESRKNHLMLFQAWLALLRRYGPAAVPDLVCVGKRGWMAEEALRLHARLPLLRGKIHLLHEVPDTALAALYGNCLFTLNNSHYEGWGLPVTESLAHGKLALVPDHSGFRDSGAAGAIFFAPGSLPDLMEKIWRLASDPRHREALEARLAGRFRLRSWAEVAAQLVRDARAGAASRLPAPWARAVPPLGLAQPLGLLPGPEPSLAMALADLLRQGAGWSAPEPWGALACLGASALRLALPAEAAGESLRVYVELLGQAEPCVLTLRALREGGAAVAETVTLGVAERRFAMLVLPAAEGGDLLLSLEPASGSEAEAGRVGVCSLMACRATDHAARLDYLESRALIRLPG
ncbi:glycosyltransferase family 4 protein [Roseicella aquatilis]|uniref:Glycosyltransferase n=1 Tax=Roseicella aquatilis TaxID=2527868 RepID=A0A4R4DJA7_9PROT|nr:glycosyltransferase [Roseicella aquatilis]TCZ61356.1 glycosyltransferase [Roseicella aquatilis]